MRISVIADIDCLGTLRDAVERYCVKAQIGRDDCRRVCVIIDELASNTVKYGHCQDCDLIVVELACDYGRLTVSYRDSGRPFDPNRQAPPPSAHPVDTEVAAGRYGWPLIRSFCSEIRYRRENDYNLLDLTIPLRP